MPLIAGRNTHRLWKRREFVELLRTLRVPRGPQRVPINKAPGRLGSADRPSVAEAPRKAVAVPAPNRMDRSAPAGNSFFEQVSPAPINAIIR